MKTRKETSEQAIPVTERIKTFEDACAALGEEHEYVKNYHLFEQSGICDKHLEAYCKLCIITEALNEEWQWTLGNKMYYVYVRKIKNNILSIKISCGCLAVDRPAARLTVSLVRTRTSSGRPRLRPSRLALLTKQKILRHTHSSNSQSCGVSICLTAKLDHILNNKDSFILYSFNRVENLDTSRRFNQLFFNAIEKAYEQLWNYEV